MTDLDGKPPQSRAPSDAGGEGLPSCDGAIGDVTDLASAAGLNELHVARRSYATVHREWTSIGHFVTGVAVADIWLVLADVARWPEWWHDLATVACDQPAHEGQIVRARLRGLPPMAGRVRTLDEGARAGLQLTFGPLLIDVDVVLAAQHDGATRIIERICMLGWGARLSGRRFDRARGEQLAASATRLVSLAVVAGHARSTAP